MINFVIIVIAFVILYTRISNLQEKLETVTGEKKVPIPLPQITPIPIVTEPTQPNVTPIENELVKVYPNRDQKK